MFENSLRCVTASARHCGKDRLLLERWKFFFFLVWLCKQLKTETNVVEDEPRTLSFSAAESRRHNVHVHVWEVIHTLFACNADVDLC